MSGLPAVPPFLNSELPPLDLLNTNVQLEGTWFDLLANKANRTDWLAVEADRLGTSVTATAAASPAMADALTMVRGHATRAIDSARVGQKPPAHALAGLNAALQAAPATPQVHWGDTGDDTGIVVTAPRHGPPAVRLAACFAEATVELLAGPEIRQVRLCEAPGCVMLFLARSPRRRWCTPDVCGNRARVARYYLRHKGDG